MADLYIITGPSGVGKSTISKQIAESKSKSALIDGDDIYHQKAKIMNIEYIENIDEKYIEEYLFL